MRKEYLPAPPAEIRLDLAILRADRDVEKQERALNKAICALHPHKALVSTMRSLAISNPSMGTTARRFWAIKIFKARKNP